MFLIVHLKTADTKDVRHNRAFNVHYYEADESKVMKMQKGISGFASTKKHLQLEYKEVVNPYLGTMPTSAHPASA